MPALDLPLLLSIFCLASGSSSSSSNLQIYPSFQAHPHWQDGRRAFPAVTDGAWLPTEPIIFYESADSSSLTLQVTVASLSSKNGELSVRVRCGSSPDIDDALRVDNRTVRICDEPAKGIDVPVKIQVRDGKWSSADSVVSYEISISILPPTQVPPSFDLADHQSVLFRYSGGRGLWLETGYIYLKRLHWLNALHKSGVITNGVKDFLLDLNFTEAFGFDSKPFLTPAIRKHLMTADDCTRSLLSLGATLEPNTDICRGSNGLPLMSDPYMFNHKWNIFKSFRIDIESGLIWYSRYGLKMGFEQFLRESHQHACPDGSPGNCVRIVGCSVFHHGHINHSFPNPVPIFKKWYRSDGTAASTSGKRECFLPPNWKKKIDIFSGLQSRPVKCPIICSMADQQYGFFKNSEPMTRSNRQEFTRHGSVLVHQSGAFLLFGPNVTHEDSGQYMCSAEHLTAMFEVEVVSLPRFSVPDTALVGGELPPRIYFMDGDGYSVNCTVFFAGMPSVQMGYSLRVANARVHPLWIHMDKDMLRKNLGVSVKVKETANFFSKTLTLKIQRAPRLTQTVDFSHRVTCIAFLTFGEKQAMLFNLAVHDVQSGSDALLVPRPSADDFVAKASPCCRDACEGQQKCRLEFSLKPTVHQHLKSLGLEVRARFVPKTTAEPQPGGPQTAAAWVREREQFRSSDSALLTWQMDEGLRQLHTDKRTLFASLLPVFFYHMTADRVGRPPKFSVHRSRVSDQLSASVCHSDPFCLFATVEESSLSQVLSVASQTGISQEYLDSLPPPPVEPATGRSNQTGAGGVSDRWEDLSERARELLEKLFNDIKNSGSDSAPSVWSALLGLLMSVVPNGLFTLTCL